MIRAESMGRSKKTISYGKMLSKDFKRYKFLYLMILPVLVFYAIFCYLPMFGVLMAFQNYDFVKGFWGSSWVGFKYFLEFFSSPYFVRVVVNTLLLNFFGLIFTFTAPIVFALLINEVRRTYLKRIIQTVSYLPFFISLVVVTGMIMDFTSQTGIITSFYKTVTGDKNAMNLLLMPSMFRPIYILSDIWQYIGFNSIIYICALSSINPELYEAALMDGANRWNRMLHITLPGISSTIIILLILQLGSVMYIGFDKVYLLYNPSIYETSDVISTYIYRQGLVSGEYSYAAAVGLFNSVVNFIILFLANSISRKVSKVSLF